MNKQTNLTMENLTTYSSPRQRLLGSFGWVTDYVHKIGDFIVTKGIVKDYVNNTYNYENTFQIKGRISISSKNISYKILNERKIELSFKYFLKKENIKVPMKFVLDFTMDNQNQVNAIIQGIENSEIFDFDGRFLVTKPTRKNGKTFSCKGNFDKCDINCHSLSILLEEEQKVIREKYVQMAARIAAKRAKKAAIEKAIYNSDLDYKSKLFKGYESLGFCDTDSILAAYRDCYDEEDYSSSDIKSRLASIFAYDMCY